MEYIARTIDEQDSYQQYISIMWLFIVWAAKNLGSQMSNICE